jgi:hypothetical protein
MNYEMRKSAKEIGRKQWNLHALGEASFIAHRRFGRHWNSLWVKVTFTEKYITRGTKGSRNTRTYVLMYVCLTQTHAFALYLLRPGGRRGER